MKSCLVDWVPCVDRYKSWHLWCYKCRINLSKNKDEYGKHENLIREYLAEYWKDFPIHANHNGG